MPYVLNSGVRIHYEVEGEGPPLLLGHGSGMDGESWRDLGYGDLLKDRQLSTDHGRCAWPW